MENRFQDRNYTLSFFRTNVQVVCKGCGKAALAQVNYEEKKARLHCSSCGYSKIIDSKITWLGVNAYFEVAAHEYFDAKLWYEAPFRNEIFRAYNEEHLLYLEAYISAKLREHKDRLHFTLLEKLPRFYHDAKNRSALLKLIAKLKNKR